MSGEDKIKELREDSIKGKLFNKSVMGYNPQEVDIKLKEYEKVIEQQSVEIKVLQNDTMLIQNKNIILKNELEESQYKLDTTEKNIRAKAEEIQGLKSSATEMELAALKEINQKLVQEKKELSTKLTVTEKVNKDQDKENILLREEVRKLSLYIAEGNKCKAILRSDSLAELGKTEGMIEMVAENLTEITRKVEEQISTLREEFFLYLKSSTTTIEKL